MSNITTAAQFRTSIHGVFHGGSKHERHSAQVITVCHHTNKLNHVCSNKQDAYSAIPHLHRGLSNHISVMLVPTYCPLLTSSKKDSITVWHSGAVSALQDCLLCTDWQVFRESAACEGEVDLEEYSSGPWIHLQVH